MHLQTIDPTIRIVQWSPSPDHCLLPSIGRSGMTLEVGPAPCGCLLAALYHTTRNLVLRALDFVQLHNEKLARALCVLPPPAPSTSPPRPLHDVAPAAKHARISDTGHHVTVTATVFCRVCSVDYPRAADGSLRAMVHPQLQGNDFVELEEGAPLFIGLDGSTARWSDL